jgi:hypothetical protein
VPFAPLLHQELIALSDGEPALLLAVAGMIGVGEVGRRRREEFRFLERLDVRECHVAARAAEAPHRRVVLACRQFGRGVGVEGGPVAAGAKLRIEGDVGARPDASEIGRSTAVLRYHGEKAKRVALTHGEEEAAGAGGEFLEVRVRALRHLYRTARAGAASFAHVIA